MIPKVSREARCKARDEALRALGSAYRLLFVTRLLALPQSPDEGAMTNNSSSKHRRQGRADGCSEYKHDVRSRVQVTASEIFRDGHSKIMSHHCAGMQTMREQCVTSVGRTSQSIVTAQRVLAVHSRHN